MGGIKRAEQVGKQGPLSGQVVFLFEGFEVFSFIFCFGKNKNLSQQVLLAKFNFSSTIARTFKNKANNLELNCELQLNT